MMITMKIGEVLSLADKEIALVEFNYDAWKRNRQRIRDEFAAMSRWKRFLYNFWYGDFYLEDDDEQYAWYYKDKIDTILKLKHRVQLSSQNEVQLCKDELEMLGV